MYAYYVTTRLRRLPGNYDMQLPPRGTAAFSIGLTLPIHADYDNEGLARAGLNRQAGGDFCDSALDDV